MKDKGEICTFKVRVADANWAAAEQRKLRKPGGRKLTQAEFFQRLRAKWQAATGKEGVPDAPDSLAGGAINLESAIREIEEGNRRAREVNERTQKAIEVLQRLAAETGPSQGASEHKRTG